LYVTDYSLNTIDTNTDFVLYILASIFAIDTSDFRASSQPWIVSLEIPMMITGTS
jgi:hypothetical protein